MDDLRNRRLFKRAYGKELTAIPAPKRMRMWKRKEEEIEKEISGKSGVPVEFIVAHKESEEGGLKSYRTFGRVTESGDIPIMYVDKQNTPHLYDDRSPISLRNEPSQILYIFTKKEFRENIEKTCEEKFC